MERNSTLPMEGRQLDLFDLEALAQDVRARARVRAPEVIDAITIARRVLGAGRVHRVPGFSTTGMLVPVDGEYRIFVRRHAADENFILAHELGHWALRQARYVGPDEETFANHIGAAIIASPTALRAAYAHHGENLPAIARVFAATQSFVVLRLAEVRRDERALVSRDAVRIRTTGAFTWPAPYEVRRWKDERPPRGVQRAKLRGPYDAGRVAFRAA